MTGRIRRFVLLVVATAAAIVAVPAPAAESVAGAVYTLSNSSAGNAVLTFERNSDGSVTAAGSTPGGGLGTGSGLGSQAAVILSRGGSQLFAVNAGSTQRLIVRRHQRGASAPRYTRNGHFLYIRNASRAPSARSGGADGSLTPLAGTTGVPSGFAGLAAA
jgi:6-phosphogluconolactonase